MERRADAFRALDLVVIEIVPRDTTRVASDALEDLRREDFFERHAMALELFHGRTAVAEQLGDRRLRDAEDQAEPTRDQHGGRPAGFELANALGRDGQTKAAFAITPELFAARSCTDSLRFSRA